VARGISRRRRNPTERSPQSFLCQKDPFLPIDFIGFSSRHYRARLRLYSTGGWHDVGPTYRQPGPRRGLPEDAPYKPIKGPWMRFLLCGQGGAVEAKASPRHSKAVKWHRLLCDATISQLGGRGCVFLCAG
jgi:hypothetical protein